MAEEPTYASDGSTQWDDMHIVTDAFIGSARGEYWTSSAVADRYPTRMWTVSVGDGATYQQAQDTPMYVRCVRTR